MAILNYTTKVDSNRTIMEIQQCLVKHGASKIVVDYENSVPVALTFCLPLQNNIIAFSLPCNYQGVLNAMTKDKNVPRSMCKKEQALRVSWRIIKDWVIAQMAIVESQLVEMSEVFLPYAITKSGNTLYNEIKSNGMLMLKNE
ncbi:MAG: hypothetical protein PHT07_14870 [Paludibacter sp.]|nr:hypothetical protein [Paludibacter sp.]